jgi:hypothetical protein
MSITLYGSVAIAFAVAAFLFSESVREPGGAKPDRPGALAVVAGLFWPVFAVGFIQWLLIALVASRIRGPRMSAAGSEMVSIPVRIDAKP